MKNLKGWQIVLIIFLIIYGWFWLFFSMGGETNYEKLRKKLLGIKPDPVKSAPNTGQIATPYK